MYSGRSREIYDLLSTLNREGLTILAATHDEDLGSIAKTTYRLQDGSLQ